jgi:hypothetical protein
MEETMVHCVEGDEFKRQAPTPALNVKNVYSHCGASQLPQEFAQDKYLRCINAAQCKMHSAPIGAKP